MIIICFDNSGETPIIHWPIGSLFFSWVWAFYRDDYHELARSAKNTQDRKRLSSLFRHSLGFFLLSLFFGQWRTARLRDHESRRSERRREIPGLSAPLINIHAYFFIIIVTLFVFIEENYKNGSFIGKSMPVIVRAGIQLPRHIELRNYLSFPPRGCPAAKNVQKCICSRILNAPSVIKNLFSMRECIHQAIIIFSSQWKLACQMNGTVKYEERDILFIFEHHEPDSSVYLFCWIIHLSQ